MSLAPWRADISKALHLNRSLPNARYLQLATVNSQGQPRNRTVVFRGFLEQTNQLKIVTDRRSLKIAEIKYQGWGAICWYFPKTREQFRLNGHLKLIDASCPDLSLQAARIKTWEQLSASARSQFAWPMPAQPRSEKIEDFAVSLEEQLQPLENFCLLLFAAVEVDHLKLRGEPQNRYIYRLSDGDEWSMVEVNP